MEQRRINIDQKWIYQAGTCGPMAALTGEAQGREVNLPHDCMLEKDVEPHSPAGHAMGYYGGIIGCYTKYLEIPKRWSCDKLYLYFDGVMAEASVEINGSPAATHCYGYTPFQADITPFVHFGESNRITVTCSVGMEPDSRWYTGAGTYRHVDLIRTPRLHIKADGIFAHTEYIDYKDGIPASARLQVEITVVNDTPDDRIAAAEASLFPAEPDDPGDTAILTGSASVLVKAGKAARVRIPMTVKHPRLWDAEHPFLYRVGASVKDRGIFRTCLSPSAGQPMEDHCFILFGIRTVTSDSIHGLRINGKTVKLKGGCIHHDNGILGAVSLYGSEYRKLKKHKESGFNAVRLAHNPPSAALLEACDRLGIYVIEEAFDVWGMPKNPGDYSRHFHSHWKEDMLSFLQRDRSHPSVLMWFTGNEIPERGGLGGGYSLSHELADFIRLADPTRPITHGLCSYWAGLDDWTLLSRRQSISQLLENNAGNLQNENLPDEDTFWEDRCCTESFPAQMAPVWALTDKLPHVIGDFTWTSWDYIGEAGIGKSVFSGQKTPDFHPAAALNASPYPWRLANCGDSI